MHVRMYIFFSIVKLINISVNKEMCLPMKVYCMKCIKDMSEENCFPNEDINIKEN